MTVLAQTRTITGPRSELLLVSTLLAFVGYVAVAATTLATEADSSSAELTAEQVSGIGAGWMVVHVLWMAPSVLAALGLAGLAARDDLAGTGARRAWVSVTVGLAALYLLTQTLAYRTDSPTWGDSGWYAVGVTLSLLVGWLGTIPATVLVSLRLARRGMVPRTGRVVAALTVIYLAWEVVTYAAIAVASPTLVDTVGPPPFVLGLLWAGLGARLWWSSRTGRAVS